MITLTKMHAGAGPEPCCNVYQGIRACQLTCVPSQHSCCLKQLHQGITQGLQQQQHTCAAHSSYCSIVGHTEATSGVALDMVPKRPDSCKACVRLLPAAQQKMSTPLCQRTSLSMR